MRALAILVAAFLAAGPAVAQDFSAYLKLTPAGRSPFNLALRCTGAPLCQGTFEVSIQESGCSNTLVLADDAALTNMVASGSRSVPTQGRITFTSLDIDENRNADGSCSFRELRDLAGTYATGPSGLLTATLVDSKGRTVAANQFFAYIEPEIAAPALDLDVVKTRIDASSANATIRIQSAPVAGGASNVYVFALAPKGLVANAAELPKLDASNCALAQLDPATNRLTGTSVAGLRPALTGVQSAQGSLVSVLGNVPTPQVAGATFFVGFGTDPATMVSQWANQNAVAVPGAQACPTEMPATPGALSGLWWNTAESGWGIHFAQRRDVVFASWFGYDAAGRAEWLVASRCAMPSPGLSSGTCTGSLYEVNGPRFFGVPFVPPTAGQVSSPGSLRVDFQDASHATMTFTAAGVTRRVSIVRQEFSTANPAAAVVDYTDLWWNPTESGWGMAITQRSGVMFLAWYVYDPGGRPTWYVASNCVVTATRDGCRGTLYRTTGPAFAAAFDPSLVRVFSAGTVSLDFIGPNIGALEYTVDGVAGSKVITRQIF